MKTIFARGALGLLTLMSWAGCGAAGEADDTEAADEAEAPPEAFGQSSQPLKLGLKPCRSTSECPVGRCTTEDGACNRPPGCGPGDICPAVCYGVCTISVATPCGSAACSAGEFCCNESCSICAPLGGACTQQFCS